MTEDKQNDKPENWGGSERRSGVDRRQSKAVFDEHGNVHTTTYSGPDRRVSADRRAHQQRQAAMAKQEKWKFITRGLFTSLFFLIALAYLINLLLAPELAKIRLQEKKVAQMEAMMAQQQAAHPAPATPQPEAEATSEEKDNADINIGGHLNSLIETANKPLPAVKNGLAAAPSALASVIQNFNTLQSSAQGQPAANNAIDTIKSILFAANGSGAQAEAALENAKKDDPAIAAVMGNVNGTDLKAAALLLALNEFRGNVDSARPFETDLAVLRKYAGDDPKLQAALTRLAPHARNGVLNRQKLSQNLEAAAGDIVMAKMRGEDASVKQRVMARMSSMVKARRVDDLTSDTPDAIVARAQKYLAENNVPAAMAELRKLDGESRQAASGIIAQGEGTIAAEEASSLMTQDILQGLSGEIGAAVQGILQPNSTPYLSPKMQGKGSSSPAYITE